MKRLMIALAVVPFLTAAAPAATQEQGRPAAEVLKENPNSAEALNAYVSEAIGAILGAIESDPAAAEKALAEMKAVIDGLKPEAEDALQMLERAKSVVPLLEQRVELARVKLDELQAKLREAPDDAEALTKYREKLVMELGSLAYSAPAEADARLKAAGAFLAEVQAKAAEGSRQGYAQTMQVLAQLGSAIESNLAREQLVGKDAAPLSVEAWVNGEPLTDADLQGKVVLLDFWAVWCGPCIATFPHLIEWNEEYGDKGLVIIGLTNYYEFRWDDEADRAVPAPGTEPEQERAMLEKFAAQHGLTHRFAIQDGPSMSEYYQVSGIPQVVVIDQQGKVRMVRVGSGDENARAIGGLIEELLGAEAKAGE